ncbi:MAG: outer membrane protein assembly factor BamA [Nitrospinota bacterium]|nr:outer membrane protein assembly factor BamA [Nitrospinota bacterium]
MILLAGILLLCSTAHAVDFSKPIKEVRIEGAVRADQNTIRYYLQTQPGQKYNRASVSSDIRKIHGLGYFDDVRVDVKDDAGGPIVTFIFKEKPFVREIIITGAQEVQKESVLLKLKTKKGSFFQKEHIPLERQRIKNLYRDKGFYFTGVEDVVHRLDNNQVDLEYKIVEGKKINVGQVIFRGNEVFPDYKLREVISTKAVTWTSLFTSGGSYKKDALKADRLLLESFYNENGFIQASVGEPQVEIDREKRKIYIYFPVSEGSRFTTGKIDVEGDSVIPSDELKKIISLKEGDLFNQKTFREDIFKINDLYSQKGYVFASVTPKFSINREQRKVDVSIKPAKGEKVYLGRLEITGNEVTRDRVIRREFLVGEGELFDSQKLRDSFKRINALGYFEKVDFEQKSRGDEDLLDLTVKVEERETGQFSFALGYSSEEYLTVTGTLKWNNLFGKGQTLSISVDTSAKREDYMFSFTEPAIFDRRFMGGFELYNHEYFYDNYAERRVGSSVTLGRGVGNFMWVKAGYKLEQNNITVGDTETASKYLLDQQGKRTVGAVFPSVVYDSKDDPYSPAEGNRFYGYLEYAGVGGDEKYYKTIAEATHYQGLLFDFVGVGHAKIGYVRSYGDKPLNVSEKFFMGGARDLRGFNIKNVGPLDENGSAIGGEALLLFNVELQYRFTRYFRGFGFYDRGNVYGKNDEKGNTTDKLYDLSNMRQSWGFGIHFFSPIGPISLIYGFKLDKRVGEAPDEFHFTIGGEF